MKKLIIILLLFCTAASASIFINNFNSGRLSPDLKVRADLERHTMGSETLTNILIRPQGMAYKRPGTEYIENRIIEVNIPGIEAVPPAQFRDQAVAIADNAVVRWFDPDYNFLSASNLIGDTCTTLAIDSDGNVMAGHSVNSNQCITRFDIDLNADTTFYVPDVSFQLSQTCLALRVTDDDSKLYALVFGQTGVPDFLYCFNHQTGAEIWDVNEQSIFSSSYAMYVDSSNNVYVYYRKIGVAIGIYVYDSSGNLDNYLPLPVADVKLGQTYSVRDIYVDEGMNRCFVAGRNISDTPDSHLAAFNLDGTNYDYFSIEVSGGNSIWSVKTDGTNVYACGSRTQSGIGGAYATVWKLNSELVLQTSYDTGGFGSHLWFDANDTLVVKDSTANTFTTLDSNLNLIESFSYNMGSIYGDEGLAIPFMTAGTPGTADQYWLFNNGERDPLRLIPFEYSVSDAYVLEFGHRYIGFLRTTP